MGFSRQEDGVGCHFLLQEIFPTQGLNLMAEVDLNLEPLLLRLCHEKDLVIAYSSASSVTQSLQSLSLFLHMTWF